MPEYLSNIIGRTNYQDMINLIFVLAFFVSGFVLFYQSLQRRSFSLKMSILIPWLVSIWGLIVWVFNNLFHDFFTADFGGFIILGLSFGGIPLALLAIVFALFSFRSVEDKWMSLSAVIYALAYLAISILALLTLMAYGM